MIAAGLALTLVFSFFFTSVAANAIATMARNPVSGMTMLTIIISSVVLLRFGLSGTTGMFFVMAIAGMVCTALSVSGQTITDLKTGYWLGSTPAAQEKVKFLGVIAASVAAGLTIVLLARAFQFGEAVAGRSARGAALPAGRHHARAGGRLHEPPAGGHGPVRRGRRDRPHHGDARRAGPDLRAGHVPAAGAEHAGAGRGDSWLTSSASASAQSVRERGVIIASGLMAGGALGGVLGAACRLLPGYSESWIKTPFFDNEPVSQLVSAALFAGFCLYLWFGSLGRGKERGVVMSARFEELVGNAILGIDTLWGGDVMCASGTGRFIADSWFSDEPLPVAYTHPTAAKVRESGGVAAKSPDREAIEAYLGAVDVRGAIDASGGGAWRLRVQPGPVSSE